MPFVTVSTSPPRRRRYDGVTAEREASAAVRASSDSIFLCQSGVHWACPRPTVRRKDFLFLFLSLLLVWFPV